MVIDGASFRIWLQFGVRTGRYGQPNLLVDEQPTGRYDLVLGKEQQTKTELRFPSQIPPNYYHLHDLLNDDVTPSMFSRLGKLLFRRRGVLVE